MAELAALLAAAALTAGGFHTPPECWSGARYTHRSASTEFIDRVTLAAAQQAKPFDGEQSPNGGYQFQMAHNNGMTPARIFHEPSAAAAPRSQMEAGRAVARSVPSDRLAVEKTTPSPLSSPRTAPQHDLDALATNVHEMSALVRIDVERGRQWLLSLRGAAWLPEARWVNEKLLFVRVHWGRIQASDLLIDVERGEVLSHELADNGEIAYQQFQQACAGRCPCEAEQSVSHARPEPISASALLGLAEIPGVGEGVAVLPQALWVREQPQADAPARSLSSLREFRTRELAYEQPALEVYALQDSWLQVALASGERAWIPTSAARLHPVELILLKRFTYLSRDWDGRLWEAAGGALGNQLSVNAGEEKTVNVLTAVRHEGRSWLQIEVYSHSPCASGDEPSVIATGWVPAHRSDGQPLVWFYSRGC